MSKSRGADFVIHKQLFNNTTNDTLLIFKFNICPCLVCQKKSSQLLPSNLSLFETHTHTASHAQTALDWLINRQAGPSKGGRNPHQPCLLEEKSDTASQASASAAAAVRSGCFTITLNSSALDHQYQQIKIPLALTESSTF